MASTYICDECDRPIRGVRLTVYASILPTEGNVESFGPETADACSIGCGLAILKRMAANPLTWREVRTR